MRRQKGIRVDDDTLATDVILELRPGAKASYLDHPHTLEHFKNEYYFPHVVIRQPRGVWESAGSPTIVDAARARVESCELCPGAAS